MKEPTLFVYLCPSVKDQTRRPQSSLDLTVHLCQVSRFMPFRLLEIAPPSRGLWFHQFVNSSSFATAYELPCIRFLNRFVHTFLPYLLVCAYQVCVVSAYAAWQVRHPRYNSFVTFFEFSTKLSLFPFVFSFCILSCAFCAKTFLFSKNIPNPSSISFQALCNCSVHTLRWVSRFPVTYLTPAIFILAFIW